MYQRHSEPISYRNEELLYLQMALLLSVEPEIKRRNDFAQAEGERRRIQNICLRAVCNRSWASVPLPGIVHDLTAYRLLWHAAFATKAERTEGIVVIAESRDLPALRELMLGWRPDRLIAMGPSEGVGNWTWRGPAWQRRLFAGWQLQPASDL